MLGKKCRASHNYIFKITYSKLHNHPFIGLVSITHVECRVLYRKADSAYSYIKTYIYTTVPYTIECTMVPICWMAKLQTRSNGSSTHRSTQSSSFQPWNNNNKRRPWAHWLSKEFSPELLISTGPMCFVFCRLYPSSPGQHGSVWFLYLSSLYSLTNNVSQLRTCLSIWLERFRRSQKADELGSIGIQSSLANIYIIQSSTCHTERRKTRGWEER